MVESGLTEALVWRDGCGVDRFVSNGRSRRTSGVKGGEFGGGMWQCISVPLRLRLTVVGVCSLNGVNVEAVDVRGNAALGFETRKRL